MTPSAFESYLAVEESSVTAGSGTLFQGTQQTVAGICVTDRRILFVPEDGGFVDVPRDQIRSIQSRPTTRRTSREIAGLLLVAAGIALTVLAAGGLLLGSPSATVLVLALVGAAGILATAAIQYFDVGLDGGDGAAVIDAIDAALARVDAREEVDVHRRNEQRVVRTVEERPLLGWAAALIGTIGAGGLAAVGAWTALALTLAAAAGIAAAVHGGLFVRELGERGERVTHDRVVSLGLVDGRVVRFRIDAEATIDRELSRLTAERPGDRLPGGRAPAEEGPAEQGASTGP